MWSCVEREQRGGVVFVCRNEVRNGGEEREEGKCGIRM